MNKKIIVISGPSGAGKGSLIKNLEKDKNFHICVSATTRIRRDREIEGQSYYFLTKDDFEKKIKMGQFIEYCFVHGQYYGTLKSELERDNDQTIILEIDTQGSKKIRKKINALYIFIAAPTISTLKKRLLIRNTETIEKIDKRLETAKKELAEIKLYDYVIINFKIKESLKLLNRIISEEKDEQK